MLLLALHVAVKDSEMNLVISLVSEFCLRPGSGESQNAHEILIWFLKVQEFWTCSVGA